MWLLVGLASASATRADAQHDPKRTLLAPPAAGEAMTCRTIPPPNRTLPPSVQSFEFNFGAAAVGQSGRPPVFVPHQKYQVVWDSAGRFVLFGGTHEASPADTIDTGFATFAGTTAPVEGLWLTREPVTSRPTTTPMSGEEIRQSQELAARLYQRRCGRQPAGANPNAPPPELIGEFRDDYGNTFRVSDSLFHQLPRMRFRIVEWNVGERFLLAQNAADNPSDAGLWTRIDWMPFSGMAPYTWGFCLTAYKAPTAAAARATPAADRSTPRTGCGGFPFSRMQRANDPP